MTTLSARTTRRPSSMGAPSSRTSLVVLAAALAFGAGCRSAALEDGAMRRVTIEEPSARGVIPPAQASGYARTSRYAEVLDVLRALRDRSDLEVGTFGTSAEGRDLPLAVWGAAGATPRAVLEAGKTRVLVVANIHAGEVAGKDAMLELLRDVAAGDHAHWADSLVVMVAPIYNADGNERMAFDNRPLQDGPVMGMGQRPNAQGLDLNRDFMKVASPEARALVGLIRDADPHVVVDLHTTNGTKMGYHLTYAPGLSPNTPAAIDADLWERWLPAISDSLLATDDFATYHYGNVPGAFGEEATAPRGWYSFSAQPRFFTNYAGLRGRYAILSEAYSYATFEDRVAVSRRFVEEVLDRAWSDASLVRRRVLEADRSGAVGLEVALRATWAALDEPADVLLGEVDSLRHPVTGDLFYRRRDVRSPEDHAGVRPVRGHRDRDGARGLRRDRGRPRARPRRPRRARRRVHGGARRRPAPAVPGRTASPWPSGRSRASAPATSSASGSASRTGARARGSSCRSTSRSGAWPSCSSSPGPTTGSRRGASSRTSPRASRTRSNGSRPASGTLPRVPAFRPRPTSFVMRPLLFPALLLALGGCGSDAPPAAAGTAGPAPEAPAREGEVTVPVVEVASAEALVDDLDGLEAETVVLNFWATWCGPCRLEFPDFIRYDAEMEGENVAVRFVSLDQPTDLPLVKSFLAEHGVEDPSYLYTGQGDMTRQLNPLGGGGAIPITMVLDGRADRPVHPRRPDVLRGPGRDRRHDPGRRRPQRVLMIRLLLFAAALSAGASAQVVYGGPLPLAGDAFRAADGSTVSLDRAAGPAGLVVVFWSDACPWTERYASRLSDLVGTYRPAGVGFVLVDSNDPATRDDDASSRTTAVAAPVLQDAGGRLAGAFGARSVPHAFFFGPDQTLLYDGTLDDSPAAPDRVRTPYLALAMDQSIAGLPVEVQRTQAFGCTIKRSAE